MVKPARVPKSKEKADAKKMKDFNILQLLNKLDGASDFRPVSLTLAASDRNALSTGIMSLDLILGGGYPPGRIVQIYGPEASGKSTCMYHACATFHKLGIPTLFFDHEASSDPDYMQRIGMDINDKSGLTRYYQPEYGERSYLRIAKVLEALPDKADGPPQIAFIIDSIASMPTKAEIDDPDKNPIGARANMHSRWLPRIKTLLARKRCVLIAVNQTRNQIGTNGEAETPAGGQAWKFFTDVMIRCSSVGQTVEEGHYTYRTMRLKTRKNKYFKPFQETNVLIRLGHGVYAPSDVEEFLVKTGFMKRGGIPKLVGIEKYMKDVGPSLDPDLPAIKSKFSSQDDFEKTTRKSRVGYYKLCRMVMESGDAAARYLGVQGGYGLKDLAAGKHLKDEELVNSLSSANVKKDEIDKQVKKDAKKQKEKLAAFQEKKRKRKTKKAESAKSKKAA